MPLIDAKIARWSPGNPVPGKGILLIRHGPRLSGSFPTLETPLSADGIALTRKFGEEWDADIPKCIITSPVPRNRQTAELILLTGSWSIPIYDSTMLGHHGPFVVDLELIDKTVKNAKERGVIDFLVDHINGKQVPGMLDRDIGVNRLLTDMTQFGGREELILAISHDSIIAATLAFGGLDPDPWPEPLCGASIIW